MKKTPTTLFLLFLSLTLWGNRESPLTAQQLQPLYQHLCEINAEWRLYFPTEPEFWLPVTFDDDRDRIQTHLSIVEQRLRAKGKEGLTDEQWQNRQDQLDRLRIYWQAGAFPRNSGHSYRRPYFVDDFGTACAVGHLLLKDGQTEIVQQINRERNFAYVRQLPYPELATWAKTNGFTVAELSLIQPGYPPDTRPASAVGNGGGVSGELWVMEVNDEETQLFIGGDFTEVDGVVTNGVIVWTGEEWETLGDGLEGTVHALLYHEGMLYAGGEFCVSGDGQICNIASWDGNTWQSMQTGGIDGPVYALDTDENGLFAGGAFDQFNGAAANNLVYYSFADAQWTNYNNFLGVNGPVYCLEMLDNELMVGGDFTQTAPGQPEANQFNGNALAFWDGNNWANMLDGPHGPVHTMTYFKEGIYVGGDLNQEHGLAIYRSGTWVEPLEDLNFGFAPTEGSDGLIHRFLEFDEHYLLVVGGFEFFQSLSFIFGYGAALLGESDHGMGYCISDKSIREAISFQGDTYMVGAFTEVNYEPYNQLIRFDGPVNTSEVAHKALDVTVRAYDGTLQVNYQELPTNSRFRLYNIHGQVVVDRPLSDRVGNLEIITYDLPNSAYFWQIQARGVQESGKVLL